MDARAGKIVAVHDRFVDIELYNPSQTIKGVVKTSSLGVDEREEEPQINIGTEVLVLIDDYGTAYAIASMSQGISVAKNATSVHKNNIHKFHGKSSDPNATVIATSVDMYSKKIAFRNDTGELFDLVSQLCQAVADSTPTGGSSAGSANAQKDTALAIKSKIDSFK